MRKLGSTMARALWVALTICGTGMAWGQTGEEGEQEPVP